MKVWTIINQWSLQTLKTALLYTTLITPLYANLAHQICDGEKNSCCAVEGGMVRVPPAWVKASTCPRGMVDNDSCTLQYGCTEVPASSQ